MLEKKKIIIYLDKKPLKNNENKSSIRQLIT